MNPEELVAAEMTGTAAIVGAMSCDGGVRYDGPALVSLVYDERGAVSLLVRLLRDGRTAEVHLAPDMSVADAMRVIAREVARIA